MAYKSRSPFRSLDSRVTLPIEAFTSRLVKAVGGERYEWAAEVAAGKPGGSRIDPRSFDNPGRFGVAYLLDELLSKFDDGNVSSEKESSTWASFLEAEELCAQTNKRLESGTPGSLSDLRSVANVFHIAARKISDLLGDFCWNEAYEGMDWGPGASTSVSRRESNPAQKYSGVNPECTIGCLALATAVVRSSPLWLESLHSQGGAIRIRDSNKVITVPKNYKKLRTIAIEPDLNMYCQKGIGRMIRRRLKRVDIDLDDQSLNQDWARLGSLFENLCTVDLSMASDTISYNLVSQLIPLPWLEALEQCRSPHGVLPSGETINYQKFSSMGNGYTFELESLIFWGLALGVIEANGGGDRRLAVYGDDIVIGAEHYQLLEETFSYAGFRTNEKKSFVSGSFRESCGKHYHGGFDVTPFYVRRPVKRLSDLFLLHNNLIRWCDRNRWNPEWDRQEMASLCSYLRSLAPDNWRKPRLPDGYGDGAFIGTFDQCTPRRHPRGWCGFVVSVLQHIPVTEEFTILGAEIASLRSLERRPQIPGLDLSSLRSRGSSPSLATRARVGKTLVQQYAMMDVFN